MTDLLGTDEVLAMAMVSGHRIQSDGPVAITRRSGNGQEFQCSHRYPRPLPMTLVPTRSPTLRRLRFVDSLRHWLHGMCTCGMPTDHHPRRSHPRRRPCPKCRPLNRTPGLVFYNGHAQSDAMMRWMASDLAGLSNSVPFLLCSVGCHAGRFDNDAWSPDSIVEEWVKHPAHGAAAAICHARLGWFDPREEWKYSGEFQLRFVDGLLQDRPDRLGPALQRAKHDLIGCVENRGTMPYRWCYYEITLLGDPHAAFGRQRAAEPTKSR